MIDWGEGEYEHTAAELEAASEHVVDVARLAAGERVLDLGCGTGNAALAAARRGAEVTGVDPAARLLSVARARADEAGFSIAFTKGDAGAIPAEDARFDAVLSVFAVIFAPDAERAASEMVRVLRPGGRAVVSTWTPEGAIARAGGELRQAMAALEAAEAPPRGPSWGEPAFIQDLFARHGARAEISEATLPFGAESAEAWLDRQVERHPVWRAVRRAHDGQPAVWADVHARMLAHLRAGDEDGVAGWRVTSRYRVVTARRA